MRPPNKISLGFPQASKNTDTNYFRNIIEVGGICELQPKLKSTGSVVDKKKAHCRTH